MAKVLGLDLGTHSIGWTIREINPALENQFVKYGVLTFEMGVNSTDKGEEPKVKKRTDSRSKRRNYDSRRYRKWAILKTLIQSEPKMCPLSIEELDQWRKYRKGIGRIYPQNPEFLNWLRLDFNNDGIPDYENPYRLRKDASENKIEAPLILGRIFYNLVQHRGFKGRDEAEAKTIVEGTNVVKGANEIRNIMAEQNTTLGGALYFDNKVNNKRIRERYNLRSDFAEEINKICEVQGIDEESLLFKKILSAIIWQRPLRSQKGNVGKCVFEPAKSRCPISHPLFEKYRALTFLNNIKMDNAFLTKEQKEIVYNKLFLRKSKPNFDFIEIIKLLDKNGEHLFNYYGSTNVAGCPVTAGLQDVFGCKIDEIRIEHPVDPKTTLKKGFYNYQDIWHILFTSNDNDFIKTFAKNKLHLNETDINKLIKIRIQQSYASLSLYVIRKMIPLLEIGIIYSHAVYLANLDTVMGRPLTNDEIKKAVVALNKLNEDYKAEKIVISINNSLINDYLETNPEERYGNNPSFTMLERDYQKIAEKINEYYGERKFNSFSDEERKGIQEKITTKYIKFMQDPLSKDKHLFNSSVPRFDLKMQRYFSKDWNIPMDKSNQLYHPSEVEEYQSAKEIDGIKYLGDPMPLSNGFKNPMALKALHQLKKLINYLIQNKYIDEETKIVIEIARELNDSNKRKAIEKYQRDREKENKKYAEEIAETAYIENLDIDITNSEIINKYRLWVEQEKRCLYTGKQIGFSQLFNGTEVDVEHTIPASISFDNEMKNLTVCFSKYNRQIKKNKIPSQLANYINDVEIDGIQYSSIKNNIGFMIEKIDYYKKRVEASKRASKMTISKDAKDKAIQDKHIASFELAYWRKKYDTFTIEEYIPSWRNSQLRDTQIITKYALPYLKTVFNKVEVQKAEINTIFRNAFCVKYVKDRNFHSHHAIDAAILTLIPSAVKRDVLLKSYFSCQENGQTFHTYPNNWKNFSINHLFDIRDNVINKYVLIDRTFNITKRKLRKRGKVQNVKTKSLDGGWKYKRDEKGQPIPIIQTGSSIRAQLHKDTYYAKIINPNSGKFSFVNKVMLNSFKDKEELESIIDNRLKENLYKQIDNKMETGLKFGEAIVQDFWMLNKKDEPIKEDKNGNSLSPIRHVRCIAKAGRGELSKARSIKEHTFRSEAEHKQQYYVQNDENYLYLLYEAEINDQIYKTVEILNYFDLVEMKVSSLNALSQMDEIKTKIDFKKKREINFSLKYIIRPGMHVLMYENNKQELLGKSTKELGKLLYRVTRFNENNSVHYIYLKKQSEASKDIKPVTTSFNLQENKAAYMLNTDKTNFIVEGYDFEFNLAGELHIK